MNTQIRRTTALVIVMFLALAGALTYVQFAKAGELRADPRNSRTYYDSFDRDRGPIVVAGGDIIVSSKPVDDDYSYQRLYADGPLYAPVTGYFTVVGPPSGIEATENDVLVGTSDSLFWTRVQDLFTGKQPRGGAVELTIEPKLQQAAWDALGDQRGAVVAFDAKTGEILAMVSKPTFDPNDLAVHNQQQVNQVYQTLEADPSRPLYNRAIGGDLYAPGSTFKLITAAAALESGRYQPDSQLDAPTALDLPGTSHKLTNFGDSSCASSGKMTLAAAMTVSCNTAFGKLGMDLGENAIARQAQAFGFGRALELPLAVTPSVFPAEMDKAQLAMAAIGQYNDKATPLQMAMVVAAIANGGSLMTPHLVRSTRDADLQVISTTPTSKLSQPISRATANQLKDMMISVVDDGTATRAQIDQVTVGAKTGTAQKDGGQAPDVWTVGFGEAAGRLLVVAVVVEDGGTVGQSASGGTVAAPIMRQVIEAGLVP
ncbi:MAG: penicillin-binding transpeptidase domain-containing protein [Micrococcales bacterium]|nr:penicillin-binding transpeptidase domain-containing protein [Micrococcales bacterium]